MIVLEATRRRVGLTQSDLAVRCGIPQTTISLLERSRCVPKPEALDRIAAVLDVSPPTALLRPVLGVLPEPETVTLP